MARGPGSNKARAAALYQQAMLASTRRQAASDAATVPVTVGTALVDQDLTVVNPILKDKLDAIDQRIDALEPPDQ